MQQPSGKNRVNRGGSWNNNAINARVSNRNNNIGFRLARSGPKFTRYFRNDPFVTDFLIEGGKRSFAVECKYNVNRDWDRTVVTARLLCEQLPCDHVLVVVPYINDITRTRQSDLEAAGGQLLSVAELAAWLTDLKGGEE